MFPFGVMAADGVGGVEGCGFLARGVVDGVCFFADFASVGGGEVGNGAKSE